MNILETKHLTKQFGGLIANNKISMHCKQGEILGLIGPNGAGKTTFLNAIAGLSGPTSGKVYFMGEECTGSPPQKMCRRGLSRTFQIPQPFPRMTAIQNVMVSAVFGLKKKLSESEYLDCCREKLDFVEFPLQEDIISETLNTVQLKRLDLARALASEPKLILLDEIASGLTEGELGDLMKIISRIRDIGVTIIMVEHIMQVIMGLCERLVVIQFGNKIAEGPTKEVAHDPKVAEAYLGAAEEQ
jgi:branched-chain amino acid transport system ATP-binding protein